MGVVVVGGRGDEKQENKFILSPEPRVCRWKLIMDAQIFGQSKQNKSAL